jgi:hypothetical protein
VSAGGSGSPLTDNCGAEMSCSLPVAFTEEMMVIRRVCVEIRAPWRDDGLAQQPGFGELVQRIVNGREGHRDPRGHGFPVQLFGSDWRPPFSSRSCAKASRCRIGRKPASCSRRMAVESGAVPFML